MRKTVLYLLLIISVSACKQSGDNNAETGGKVTQTVTQKDSLSEIHGPQLLPVDEAAKDSSFLHFRNSLLEAIYAHNEKYLLGILDKNIKIGFGGHDGINAFKKQWQANNYERLWPLMKVILENGGAFMKDSAGKDFKPLVFMAPYVFSNWPDSLDAFTYVAIINKDVIVHKQAATESKTLTKLSYEIVKGNLFDANENNEEKFVQIETSDGKIKGYVKPENLYSPIGYRALFGKENSSWKIQALVAGD